MLLMCGHERHFAKGLDSRRSPSKTGMNALIARNDRGSFRRSFAGQAFCEIRYPPSLSQGQALGGAECARCRLLAAANHATRQRCVRRRFPRMLSAESASEKTPGSPGEDRTREWQAIARAFVADLGHGSAASELDASLWLAAHEDDKLRVLAGLRAQLLIGDDQGRS